jgi:hypothetical protein
MSKDIWFSVQEFWTNENILMSQHRLKIKQSLTSVYFIY